MDYFRSRVAGLIARTDAPLLGDDVSDIEFTRFKNAGSALPTPFVTLTSSTARKIPFEFEFEAAAGAFAPTVDDTSDFWLDGIPLPSRFRPGIIAPLLLRTSPERNVPAK
jgi:hypothetical protein